MGPLDPNLPVGTQNVAPPNTALGLPAIAGNIYCRDLCVGEDNDETPRFPHDRCSGKFVAANGRARPRCLAATEHHDCGAVSGGGLSRLGGSFVCAAFSGEVPSPCRRRKQKRGPRPHWGGHPPQRRPSRPPSPPPNPEPPHHP